MLSNDKKKEYDVMMVMADYLASFWNPEAVKKIQEDRKSKSAHNFKDDNEFEESLVSGEYKNNPLLDAFIKMRKNERNNEEEPVPENKLYPKSRLPTDLSSIRSTLNKFNKV